MTRRSHGLREDYPRLSSREIFTAKGGSPWFREAMHEMGGCRHGVCTVEQDIYVWDTSMEARCTQ